MSLKVVAEHTIDTSLLTPGGFVLDAGCRNFGFSRGLIEHGCRVIAMDADPTVKDPDADGLVYLNFALAAERGVRTLVMHQDPQARYLAPAGVAITRAPHETVEAVTITDIMKGYFIEHFDVVKLDIEGSEYDILKAWPGPIATQLSIEFHEHVCPRPQKTYDEIFEHLGQWYNVIQHNQEARHCCPEKNWWDSLLTLKEAR